MHQSDPKQSTMTPKVPKTIHNNPQQPTTTHNGPRQPKTTLSLLSNLVPRAPWHSKHHVINSFRRRGSVCQGALGTELDKNESVHLLSKVFSGKGIQLRNTKVVGEFGGLVLGRSMF